MNNCNVELVQGTSKKGNEYAFLKFTINGSEIGKLFIKLTELPYYKNLIK